MPIDKAKLIELLQPIYPLVARDADDGVHLGMAALSQLTREAIYVSDWQEVQKLFLLVNTVFLDADEHVKNAVFVSYLENVLLGETDARFLEARAMLPPRLARAILQLEAHFKWLNRERPTNTILHFISGHLDLSQTEFETYYRPRIDEVLARDQEGFVVGDAKGADEKAQQYLLGKTEFVFVYYMLESPRFNAGFYTVGGFSSDTERDTAMTKASDFDLAWVRAD